MVCADHEDTFYAEADLKNPGIMEMQLSIYTACYHEYGLVSFEDTGLGLNIIQKYKDSAIKSAAKMISPGDAKARFNGLYCSGH